MTRTIEEFPLPTDSALRKEMPICEGLLDYFPLSAAYVSRISFLGNEKHNPGEKLHWARGKSMDQDDCIVRHTIERGTFDPDDGALHDGKRAWRSLAALELELERRLKAGLPIWREDIIAENRRKQAERLEALKSEVKAIEQSAKPRDRDQIDFDGERYYMNGYEMPLHWRPLADAKVNDTRVAVADIDDEGMAGRGQPL